MYLTRLFPKASLVLKLSPLFGTNRRKTQETKVALRKAKTIRPFPSSPGLCFKTRVGAQPLIWKSFFHSHANKTHFHQKGCSPSLILKVRVFGTRKWSIH